MTLFLTLAEMLFLFHQDLNILFRSAIFSYPCFLDLTQISVMIGVLASPTPKGEGMVTSPFLGDGRGGIPSQCSLLATQRFAILHEPPAEESLRWVLAGA